MRVLLFLLFSLYVGSTVNAQIVGTYATTEILEAKKNGQILIFDEEHIDLGPLKKGEKRTFHYRFLNIGTEPIQFDFFDVCVCSEVFYDEDANILPGEEGVFKVVFDSGQKDKDDPVTIDFQIKNIDKKINLPYFFSLEYTFQFAKP